jgi:hypothetical protein
MRNVIKIIILAASFALCAEELFPVATIVEPDTGQSFGWSVCSWDYDRDGVNSVVVGAPFAAGSAGCLYIYNPPDFSTFYLAIYGENLRDQLGISLDCAGDFNGDGFDDLIAGANFLDTTGGAAIYYGGTDIDDVPDVVFHGEQPYDNFGYAVAGIGDIDGDGFDDVAVGALENDCRGWRTGKVYIYFGGASPDNVPDIEIEGLDSLSNFGCDIDGGFDFDGDDVPDLLVGAVQAGSYAVDPGEAFVFSGSALMHDYLEPEFQFHGEVPTAFFGGSVAALGDVNGDARDDVVCGSYNYCESDSCPGRAYVFTGRTTGSTDWIPPDMVVSGRNATDGLGGCVGAIKDLNGDGFNDIAIAASYDSATTSNVGQVLIYDGGVSFDGVADYVCRGSLADDNYAWAIEAIGDVTADGFPDFAVGAPSYSDTGKVFIYAGFSSTSAVTATLIDPFDYAVSSVARQPVRFLLRTSRILDYSTARASINGESFDHLFEFSGDTAIFLPSFDFIDGDTVLVCLSEISTTVGDTLLNDVCTHIIADLTPPVQVFTVPHNRDTVNYRNILAGWLLTDEVSGKIDSAAIATTGSDTLTTDFKTIGKYYLFSTTDAETVFASPSANYRICIKHVCDIVDYGSPNCADSVCVVASFARGWMSFATAKREGKKATSLVVGQNRGATEHYDPSVDLLMLPPTSDRTDAAILCDGIPLQRSIQDELADSVCYNILNREDSEIIVKVDRAFLPEGAFLFGGKFDVFIADSIVVAPLETLQLIVKFLSPKVGAITFPTGWSISGVPGYPSYNNIADIDRLGIIGCWTQTGGTFSRLSNWIGGIGFYAFSRSDVILPIIYYDTRTQYFKAQRGWQMYSPPFDNAPLSTDPAGHYIPPAYRLDGTIFNPVDSLQAFSGYWLLITGNAVLKMGE